MTHEQDRYESEIRRPRGEVESITASSFANATRFAEDIAAARAVAARLRAAICDGASDAVQASAIRGALNVWHGDHPARGEVVEICAGFLALHERHKATSARLDAMVAGVERIAADARASK